MTRATHWRMSWFIWAYGSRGMTILHGKSGRTQAWWLEQQAESSHLKLKAQYREGTPIATKARLQWHASFHRTPPPKPPQTAPPTATKYSNVQDCGEHLLQTAPESWPLFWFCFLDLCLHSSSYIQFQDRKQKQLGPVIRVSLSWNLSALPRFLH